MAFVKSSIKLLHAGLFCYALISIVLLFEPLFAGRDSLRIAKELTQAEKYFYERKFDSAKIIYSLALSENSKNIDALIGLGKIEFTQQEYEEYIKERSFLSGSMDMDPRKGNGKWYGLDITKFGNSLEILKKAKEIDPLNIGLNYFLAILYRDMVKLELANNHKLYLLESKKSFETVLSKDSVYENVLMQYAILLMNEDDNFEAMNLIKKQIALKSDYPDSYFVILKIARQLFESASKEKILEYFSKDKDDLNKYLFMEFKRYSGDYEDAKQGLENMLLQSNETVPKGLILSSLMKIYVKENNKEKVFNSYNRILSGLKSRVDAEILFHDLRYIADKEEFLRFENSNPADLKRIFFSTFWNKRSAQSVNFIDKIFEHYSRLVYTEENYSHNRELFRFFKPMDSYAANKDFYDAGLIYLKYGKPDKVFRSTGEMFFERWLYHPSSNAGLKAFGFFGTEKRLARNAYNEEILEEMKRWDSKYYQYLRKPIPGVSAAASSLSSTGVAFDKNEEEKKELIANLSEERSEINLTQKQIVLNFQAYRFRGKNNKTDLLVSYFFPIPHIFKELPDNLKQITAECGYSFFDQEWNILAKKHDSVIYQKSKDGGRPEVKFVSLEVDTGKVNSWIYCNPSNTGLSCFNKGTINIPEYSKTDLCSSDIMISVIDNKISRGKKWNQFYLLPSPTTKWSLRKPIKLYYEIYNLKKNLDGKTLYRLEYAFRYKGNDDNLLTKLFGKNKQEEVSTEHTKSGRETESHEFMSFDLNRLSPGDYIVEITVKDMNANKNITLKKEVELY